MANRLPVAIYPLFGILLAGCVIENKVGDGTGTVDELGDNDPCIVVTPSDVVFDAIRVMQDPAQTQVVTVANRCEGDYEEGDLEIYGLSIQGDTAPFSIGEIGSVLLTAEGETDFTVTFDPKTSNLWHDKVLIDSNDPLNPVVEVTLTGEGIAPIIDVDPEAYDFGAPFIGCQLEQPYTVSNIGNADLVVADFDFTTAAPDFEFDPNKGANGDLPYTIAPEANVEVYVNYLALDDFGDTAFLTVYSNDPFTPEYLVHAEGIGTYYGDNLDIFTQPLQSQSDIIFTIDRSCSMDDDNLAMMNNLSTFVDALVGLDANFHLAAVANDDGCVMGDQPYIDESFTAAEASDAFEYMVDYNYAHSTYGIWTEAGYSLGEAALADDNIESGGCNDGMYRDKAFLSIVHVSDEPEQSINSWSYYVNLFQSMKGDPDDVVINAVAGDYPSGCGSASPGTGYYEGTVATGGLYLSICATDWGAHLESLAEGSVSINNSFELTQNPVPPTIEVKVDGVTQTVGWEYDPTINSVVFETDYIPSGGATVEVYYQLQPDCEG